MRHPGVLGLHYSRWLALTVLVLATASLTGTIPVLLWVSQLDRLGPLGWLGMAVLLPVYLWLYRYVYIALTQREAVVTLDAHGITDTRKRIEFVHWQDVRQVRLGIGSRSQYLCLELKPAAVPGYRRGPAAWHEFWRFFTSQGDWDVYLLTLSGSRIEVWKSAEALRKAAIQARVRELNQSHAAHAH